ncbi:DUF3618 domain-containing protein [Haloactinopolyspora sp.]|uniref:DUF3618 domain-containing protein n=1 Tax=Haloactinopolyspora sp. TaxID=1966353 RepID=UPI002620124E|nr:DUF3618 domain-containing protein [Haloactinopolyspora sp.]
MSAPPDQRRPAVEPPDGAGVDELAAHIEQTRHELGETVEALSRKLDVREQTQRTVAAARDAATRPVTLAVAGAVLVAAVAGIIVWRYRR